jgi:anti-sigma factor RsiW
MDCTQCHTAINRYVDGELGPPAVAEFQAHLSFCPSCAAELRDLSVVRRGLALLGEIELPAPEGFANEVMMAIDSQRELARREKLRKLAGRAGMPALPAGRRAVALSALATVAALAIGLEARHLRRQKEARA